MNELQKKTISWLVNGELGESSKTMAFFLAFDEVYRSGRSHPLDPADLQRCLKLLKAVPEMRPLLPKMKEISNKWGLLIDHWQAIEESFVAEAGENWEFGHAPKTFVLMQRVCGYSKTYE